jgi:hypothetical protein
MKLDKKETFKFAGFDLVVLALPVISHALHLGGQVAVIDLLAKTVSLLC